MKRCLGLTGALLLFSSLLLWGDVIYLKNGNVLVVEKAWEEGDQVKYQLVSGVQTIPRASVKRLQSQKAVPADPSRNQSVKAVVIRGQGTAAAPSAAGKSSHKPAATDSRASARSARFQDAAGYKEALRAQETTGKPVALYFYVDWCGYCAKLERGILSRQEVKQYLETVLYVSVNPEHGKAEEALFASFEGRGFPAFLILAKNQPAREIPTSAPPEVFLQACKEAAKGGNR
ncbi:MAG: thioredoxin family protein [Acidobacteria bacterium]|nr:thioredoxin family protein [Acidobacteriota bacterium]MCI0718938.1 thioredoxin family protein [Acidobacteriota bacterium]